MGDRWAGNGQGLWNRAIKNDRDLSKWLATELVPKSWRSMTRYSCLALEYTGHGVPWILLALCGLFLAGDDYQLRHISLALLIGLMLDLVTVAAAKVFASRPRPPHNDGHTLMSVAIDRDNAFPSGHATRGVFVAAFASLFLSGISTALVVAWAICLSSSRVLIGRHHVLDVLAAFPLGVLEAQLTALCYDRLSPYFDSSAAP